LGTEGEEKVNSITILDTDEKRPSSRESQQRVLDSHKESEKKIDTSLIEGSKPKGETEIMEMEERIKMEKEREEARQKELERFKNIRFQYLINPKHIHYDSFLREGLEYPVVPQRLLPTKTDIAFERDGIPQLVCIYFFLFRKLNKINDIECIIH